MNHPPGILQPPPGLARQPPPGLGQAQAQQAAQAQAQAQSNQSVPPGGTAVIVRAQIVFLLTTFTEDGFDKAAAEIRALAASHGPEMYHHYLRRTAVVANPVLQPMLQAISDDPSVSKSPIPTVGQAALAWRLLQGEAERAARDPQLAPHFSLTLLSASPSTPLPLPSLKVFNLPPAQLFTLSLFTLAQPSVYPPTHGLHAQFVHIAQSTVQPATELLRTPGRPFWSSDDLTVQQASAIVAALYPEGPAVLDTRLRAFVLQSLAIKFASPAIIIQSLSSVSPGGKRSENGIPLEDLLFELGENLTHDEGVVAMAAERWWVGVEPLTDEVTATINGLIEGLAAQRSIDVHGVIKGLSSLQRPIDWPAVLRQFDTPNSAINHPAAFPLIASILIIPSQSPPPFRGLLGSEHKWQNQLALCALFERILSVPHEAFPLFTSPNSPDSSELARVVEPQQHPNAQIQSQIMAAQADLFNSLDLIDWIAQAIRQADGDVANVEQVALVARRCSDLLERAIAQSPDLVLLGLAKIEQPLPQPLQVLSQRLRQGFLAGGERSQMVFWLLYQTEPEKVLEALVGYYGESEANVVRVVDIAQDLKILDKLLAQPDYQFALDVAALASKREAINLEKWLTDGVDVRGEDFLQAMFDFVENKIRIDEDRQDGRPPALSPAVYAIFFRVIRGHAALTPQDVERFKGLRKDVLIMHPRLMNLAPGADKEAGLAVVSFSKEVDAQVDTMYQRMYAELVSLDDVLAELRRLKASDQPRDHEIFACMLHSLFDEYQFVKGYPPRELAMTGLLFGSIISCRLVENTPLHVATRYVLDALASPPDSPLFQFGINALNIFQGRLVDFPHMCNALLQISHLHETHPTLITVIRNALHERENRTEPGEKLAFPIVLQEIEGPEAEVPDDKKKDRILFIVNNLAPNNFEDKAGEMKAAFEERFAHWFANYFVDVRVSLEANRHELYLQFMDALDVPMLEKHVLHETYRKAADLLNSERTVTEAPERVTLKNIASWLGRLTLGRNLPIRAVDLSVKDILIQGYDAKRLIVAIPFVCKLLEQCSQSTVFHPPNPWLMAVLRLLVELYEYADLKLNLKFEIEVLCKNLNIDLAAIEPTDLLQSRMQAPPDEPQGRLTQELERATNALPRFGEPATDSMARVHQLQTEQAAQAAQDAFLRRVDDLVGQLPEYLVFSQEYPIFQAPTLKRIVHHSIDRAIREIINPVVERSVTIAGISSRDLLVKDFGMEGDANKMRAAAHLMVQNLAGNLALVTCKEPLRTSMVNNVRGMMLQNGFTDETMPEVAITGVVGDNLEVACSVIKKAAMEKAVKDIDVNLAASYAARKRHRETRNPQPFWDGSSFSATVSQSSLPELLRLHNGGLDPAQLRVYEDFGETSRLAQPPSAPNGEGYMLPPGYSNLGLEGEIKRGSTPYSRDDEGQQPTEKFQELIAEAEKFFAHAPVSSISVLPAGHEVRQIIHRISAIASQAPNREQTTLAFSQKVVQLLYKSASALGREVYVLMLQQLCDLVPSVDKEVKQWLIYAEDVRKFNVPVTVTLIRAGLINVTEHDQQLAQIIQRNFAPEPIDFEADLVRECLFNEPPTASRHAFAAGLAALLKAQELGRSTPIADQILADLRTPSPEPTAVKPVIDSKTQDRLAHYFLEWVRVFASSKSPEAAFVPYVALLSKEGILNGENLSMAFYRTSIGCAVDLDKKTVGESLFHGTDALAKLLVLIVKNYGDKSGTPNVPRTIYYFNKIITIISYTLVQRHLEQGDSFDQRPWARFYTSLLSEFQSIELALPETYIGCLKTFANSLGIIQPAHAPKFAFGWVSIVSHRLFMPRILQAPKEEGWADFHRVLMALFKFLSTFLEAGEMATSSRSIFRATIRILLVLMHDFPEFLVEYCHTLCAALPAHCVQLRNIVLAAFPRSHAPLPSCYNRLDDLVPEMQRIPHVRSDYISALLTGDIKGAIDQYVRTGSPNRNAIIHELKNRIAVRRPTAEGSIVVYNHTLLHAAVLYLGAAYVDRRAAAGEMIVYDDKAPEVSILGGLLSSFDGEGQYYMLNAIANQLRFASAHTLFFSSLILHMFMSAQTDGNVIPERIGRVLLERVLVRRPHPWGLIVTFVELLDNEVYNFWKQPFVRMEHEIFLLFGQAHKNMAPK